MPSSSRNGYFASQFTMEQRLILDALPDGVLLTDASGTIFDANQPFCEMVGYNRAELIGIHVSRCVEPTDLKERPPREKEFLEKRRIRSHRQFRSKGGTVFWVDLHARRVNDGFSLTIVRRLDEKPSALHGTAAEGRDR